MGGRGRKNSFQGQAPPPCPRRTGSSENQGLCKVISSVTAHRGRAVGRPSLQVPTSGARSFPGSADCSILMDAHPASWIRSDGGEKEAA